MFYKFTNCFINWFHSSSTNRRRWILSIQKLLVEKKHYAESNKRYSIVEDIFSIAMVASICEKKYLLSHLPTSNKYFLTLCPFATFSSSYNLSRYWVVNYCFFCFLTFTCVAAIGKNCVGTIYAGKILPARNIAHICSASGRNCTGRGMKSQRWPLHWFFQKWAPRAIF